MQFNEERTAILTEAQDVTTPASRLDELAHEANDLANSYGPDHALIFGTRLMSYVACNPNISPDTMAFCAEHAPTFLLDNPALPFAVITGDILCWEWTQISWLRRCALETGHAQWHLLITVCAPQWRKRRRSLERWHCWDATCVRCYPERHVAYVQRWQQHHKEATPGQPFTAFH